MSIAPTEPGRKSCAETRLHSLEQTNEIVSEEWYEDAVLRDLTRFVEDSDRSIPRIAELLQVSGVTLTMWIARRAKPSTIKLREIESFLQRCPFD